MRSFSSRPEAIRRRRREGSLFRFPTWSSLAVIGATLAATVVASLRADRRDPTSNSRDHEDADRDR